MDSLKKFKELFEANIKDNKGVTDDYLQSIEDRAMELYGNTGLSQREQQEIGGLFHKIFSLQRGHEEELSKIGEDIIMEAYGSILDGVKLDLKIVRPDDSEKREMVDKMFEEPQSEENEESEIQIETDNVEIEIDINEVDKRKLLNNVMQGEAQNVHSMLHNKKDEIDAISQGLVENSLRFLELNEKIMWDINKPSLEDAMANMPDMANAVEVDWEDEEGEEGEEGEKVPTIKVRALEITMILHETVKGIYELIMANAIPADPAMAEKILAETDTVKNEDEDIRYGKFIAADLRDYINNFLESNYSNTTDIPNIREFVYGGLAEMNAELFLDFMKKVLTNDFSSADSILKNSNIVENIMKSFDEYNNFDEDNEPYIEDETDDEIEDNNEPISYDYSQMSKQDLQSALDTALDADDYVKAEEIGKFL